jgi:hypothetical protein
MMRLTVNSGKDGRFLARVIDPGGFPFVLDFGDRRIIDDVQQRLLHGFTMWRFGQHMTVGPQDPDMVRLLAEFYAGEGLLVTLEEPTWAGRAPLPDAEVPPPVLGAPPALEDEAADAPTEVAARDTEDELTEIVPEK